MAGIDEQVEAGIQKRLNDPVFLQEQLLQVWKENTRLIDDKKRLAETVLEKEQELEALAPAREFYSRVTESADWMEMAAVSKVLAYKGYGRNSIFELLRERQVLRYNNEPYQKYVERGYFKTVERDVLIANGETIVNRKTMVSQKGLDFIRKLIEEDRAA